MGSPGRSTTSTFRKLTVDGSLGVCVPAAFRITYPAVDVAPYDEDCLFLNEHIPSERKSNSLLPVIVYIHGGGYDAGSATVYPVHDFVTLSDFGVIAVAVQYRLGVFGFLSGQKVKDAGDLNVGLLDQDFALQWVQKHISSFGGDPARVTIWGQSAGAGAMLQHVVAHGGNTQPPLFRAVIANSPILNSQYQFNDPIPEALYSAVASEAGCGASGDSMKCLRDADASTLLAAGTQIGISGFLGLFSFVPVIDGKFIVERPSVTLKRGNLNEEFLLLTTDADEGALFVNPDALKYNNLNLCDYTRGGGDRVEQASQIIGDALFVCPAYYLTEGYGSRGWKAQFAIPPGFHAQDLSNEFSTFAVPPTVEDSAFIDAFRQSFMSTAIFMDPNIHIHTSILPVWTPWGENHTEMKFGQSKEGPFIQVFDSDPDLLERCGFWQSLAAVNSQ